MGRNFWLTVYNTICTSHSNDRNEFIDGYCLFISCLLEQRERILISILQETTGFKTHFTSVFRGLNLQSVYTLHTRVDSQKMFIVNPPMLLKTCRMLKINGTNVIRN